MSWQNYNKNYITNNVTVNEETDCWEWNMQRDDKNYGRCGKGSGEVLAHRLSYRLFKGDIGYLFVLHKCDNPPCCNPNHLFLGTQADNTADAIAKGRQYTDPNFGDKALRISEEKRLEVITLAGRGVKTGAIATKLNISIRSVSRIKQTIHGDSTT